MNDGFDVPWSKWTLPLRSKSSVRSPQEAYQLMKCARMNRWICKCRPLSPAGIHKHLGWSGAKRRRDAHCADRWSVTNLVRPLRAVEYSNYRAFQMQEYDQLPAHDQEGSPTPSNASSQRGSAQGSQASSRDTLAAGCRRRMRSTALDIRARSPRSKACRASQRYVDATSGFSASALRAHISASASRPAAR
jgi:hypothetical protein